ncbi:3'-5' exonuclease [Sulfurihydrogenibium azorense]|jgi:DNA polymerase-3 subunit epsilon|uniref:DNA polymerase III subunit epsilon n=1 Tax=Sulfurihydrogenibium azorense (strain DSM 15241 / OCM 825 / Az-Fu1) TaxID=204536 RepID=C1DWC5_SULAA|nr:3'-5' exonuclease [Sulfurihydrogenibium azorense]ACN98240.1 DNA polymerase III subunit epsilon [Sulfurihydrogenibium azorense Az-Fu1]MDM7274296.1 3'-5' exonuclease [Sulfurihydrogenibium azorense]
MINLLKRLKKEFLKKKLKDNEFLFLFDDPPEDEYVVFDTETTGLNPKTDDILSIGAVKIKQNRILLNDRFYTVVKPEREINEETIKIHGLRKKDLENGIPIEKAIKDFLRFIGSRPLVGYYIDFDVAMINKYTKKIIGIPLPNKKIEVSGMYYDYKIGTIPQGFVDLRFDSILKGLKIPSFGKHDALNDAIMTGLIFLKLKSKN